MKLPSNPPPPFLSVGRLKISTDLRLHPEFIRDAASFARAKGVRLAGKGQPQLDYRDDRETGKKNVIPQANFHLVNRGAIGVFMKCRDGIPFIKSLDLNPALLLGETGGQYLTERELLVCLTTLLREVAPLLADEGDVLSIVPGLKMSGERPAYWSRVECEAIVPRVRVQNLHRVAHPITGLARGSTERRLELKTLDDKFRIEIENVPRPEKKYGDPEELEGVRIGLRVKGSLIRGAFGRFGKFFRRHMDSPERLVRFSLSDLAAVHFNAVSMLEGVYLPRPDEWIASDGKRMTPAKVMALLSEITDMSTGQLRGIHDELRPPSSATRTRMNKNLRTEMQRLVPAPVATILPERAQVNSEDRLEKEFSPIDPTIEKIYGGG